MVIVVVVSGKICGKMCGKICGKIKINGQIGTKIGVVVDMDSPIMIVVCGSQDLWLGLEGGEVGRGAGAIEACKGWGLG